MDEKEFTLSVIMILSSLILTHKWLTRIGQSDVVILISAMVLIGSLAGMILLLDSRIRTLEKNLNETMNAKERSIRINIQGVEEKVEKRLETFLQRTTETLGDMSKKMYR